MIWKGQTRLKLDRIHMMLFRNEEFLLLSLVHHPLGELEREKIISTHLFEYILSISKLCRSLLITIKGQRMYGHVLEGSKQRNLVRLNVQIPTMSVRVGLFKLYFSHHCTMAGRCNEQTYNLNSKNALLLAWYPAWSCVHGWWENNWGCKDVRSKYFSRLCSCGIFIKGAMFTAKLKIY